MPKARSQELPGMKNRAIRPLHEAALEYAEIRDKRMALNQQEVALKTRLLNLMHKHRKDVYSYDGVEVRVVQEEETVKVRIRKPEAEEDSE